MSDETDMTTPSERQDPQQELFPLQQIQGFSALTRRERLFAQAILDGASQTEAARRAGVGGSASYVRKAGTLLARKPTVRAVLDQAWSRAGASLDASLRRTAAIAQRGFCEWSKGETAQRRTAARAEWKDAETLLASIHGKLGVEVRGTINHEHSGGLITVPVDALDAFAQLRRAVVVGAMAPKNTQLSERPPEPST